MPLYSVALIYTCVAMLGSQEGGTKGGYHSTLQGFSRWHCREKQVGRRILQLPKLPVLSWSSRFLAVFLPPCRILSCGGEKSCGSAESVWSVCVCECECVCVCEVCVAVLQCAGRSNFIITSLFYKSKRWLVR